MFKTVALAEKKNYVQKTKDGKFFLHLNSDDFVFTQYTALCSVPLDSQNHILKDAEPYVNSNKQCFSNLSVLKYYQTFKGAHVFKNHTAAFGNKGIVLDTVLRLIRVNDITSLYYVDLISATSKIKDPELYEKVKSGKITDSSMGASAACSVCNVCGNVATEDWQLCEHIQPGMLGKKVFKDDGFHMCAEIMNGRGDEKDENGNLTGWVEWVEQSWLDGESPASKAAVVRNVLEVPEHTDVVVPFEAPYVYKHAIELNLDCSELGSNEEIDSMRDKYGIMFCEKEIQKELENHREALENGKKLGLN